MTSRERVKRAMRFMPPDKVPVQFCYAPVGYYEHGDKLNDLYARLPGDFGPFERAPVPAPSENDYDPDGSFHAFRRDEWGTLREYRIFGIAGMPVEYPLADIGKLDAYVFPPAPALDGPSFENHCRKVGKHQEQYYFLQGAGSLFERMTALRPEADVLCDIALNEPGIRRLADKITAYNAAFVSLAVKAGADGISFGDDYGTERSLVMSPAAWRAFIKPRLKKLFLPAVKAGLDIHFHSCGQIGAVLGDLKEIGVTSVWLQLPAYDMEELAARCRALGLAAAIHTDRANTMTYSTPRDVRELVLREYEAFRMAEGGAWFYIEADNGFPFENLEALIRTIEEIR
ncbi:MAG TPA: uroporphyrinogen decarboxylase family protein [Clostridiales bacterium]|nr:MAG: methylcobalamin:coenzyme M methyltransferase [Firmicutes bacterium ADurb.Bin262]HOU09910.1 uroporphyrinogen decarboxylase family protein [Clostridiales bacterium]HQH62494.1 uroporphyrinogen decarboxylase family protein [Clostridiales bacterium]HQK72999.1 uroporphyrinogen decarboxylase family protein [Clostridiales bacterium]